MRDEKEGRGGGEKGERRSRERRDGEGREELLTLWGSLMHLG